MIIACDTHVHCYRFGRLGELLDNALINFDRYASDATHRVLFFTDGQTDKTWPRLMELMDGKQAVTMPGGWKVQRGEANGFLSARKDEEMIYLAPARQLNSAERIEFLVLGCRDNAPDGATAKHILSEYVHDYVVISPWGVGKWLGERGKILSDLIVQKPKDWFLGDNGGRPAIWVGISQCKLAREHGMAIFNGSDPLPIDGELSRIAAYGIRAEIELPEFTLSDLLLSMKLSPQRWHNFGKALGLFRFIKGRIAMARR